MNIRNGIDQVNSIFPSPVNQVAKPLPGSGAALPEHDGQDQAKLSITAGQAASTAAESDVRMDKVASIQSALQAGTYQVPSDKVAEKVISSMLNTES